MGSDGGTGGGRRTAAPAATAPVPVVGSTPNGDSMEVDLEAGREAGGGQIAVRSGVTANGAAEGGDGGAAGVLGDGDAILEGDVAVLSNHRSEVSLGWGREGGRGE